MSRITDELIRKKAEHHDGLITDLEELSLHQLELERIEVVGSLCRKLKILYLQNNIIPKIENLQHLKELRYLNLALNNITKIEGLSSCEFLEKLDLTVNFVDVDTLEESTEHLSGLLHLRELYLMGNPCLEWTGCRDYVIARVPQIQRFDGKDVTRSERIGAAQRLKELQAELRELAARKREEKGVAPVLPSAAGDDDEDTQPWCPETRVKMYKELAESKAEKEKRRTEMEPPKIDNKKVHAERVGSTRAKESEGNIKQCNEGRWHFELEDEDGKGNVVLHLHLSKYLDTSLIDVDVHPFYISIVIKGKVFRLALQDEVRSSAAACQRSQTTGELVVTMPKQRPNPVLSAARMREKKDAKPPAAAAASVSTVQAADPKGSAASKAVKLGDELLEIAKSASLRTNRSATADSSSDYIPDGHGGTMLFREATKPKSTKPADDAPTFVDDDDVPPLV